MDKVTITMTVNDWNVVMGALGKMPFESVVSVVNQIKEQAEPQMKPAAEAASE